jgi:hypothetical protein
MEGPMSEVAELAPMGYMNAHHQRVVGRAVAGGKPLNVWYCTVCHRYYGAAKGDLAARQCPSSQPVDHAVDLMDSGIEWL